VHRVGRTPPFGELFGVAKPVIAMAHLLAAARV
jgi:hypothetical protein